MNPPGTGAKPPPGTNGPVLLDRRTAEAFAESTRYVRTMLKGRDSGSGPRTGGVNPGIYAKVTTAITAASGAALGQGIVTLCSRSGSTLTADGETGVTVYNAGGSVAVNTYVSLAWVDGDWSTSVAPC